MSSTGVPLGYSTPAFPSLYWLIRAPPGTAQYLYYTSDMLRFIMYWTLILFGLVHSAVAAWAVLMQFHSAMTQRRRIKSHRPGSDPNPNPNPSDEESSNPRLSTSTIATKTPAPLLVSSSPVLSTLGWVWIIPVVYLVIGGLEALFSGGLVGLLVGAVYNAGYFKMSTWTPFLWGIINCLVVILGSFRIQGGL